MSLFPYLIPPAQAWFNISTYCAFGEKEKKKSGLWRLQETDWRKGDKIERQSQGEGEAAISSKWDNWCDSHKSSLHFSLFCHGYFHIGFFRDGDQQEANAQQLMNASPPRASGEKHTGLVKINYKYPSLWKPTDHSQQSRQPFISREDADSRLQAFTISHLAAIPPEKICIRTSCLFLRSPFQHAFMTSTENDNPLFVTLQSFLLQSSVLSKKRITASVWRSIRTLRGTKHPLSKQMTLVIENKRRQRYKTNTTCDQICHFQEASNAL